MLESIQAMSLLTIMEIVGPVFLLAVLIYGTLQSPEALCSARVFRVLTLGGIGHPLHQGAML